MFCFLFWILDTIPLNKTLRKCFVILRVFSNVTDPGLGGVQLFGKQYHLINIVMYRRPKNDCMYIILFKNILRWDYEFSEMWQSYFRIVIVAKFKNRYLMHCLHLRVRLLHFVIRVCQSLSKLFHFFYLSKLNYALMT